MARINLSRTPASQPAAPPPSALPEAPPEVQIPAPPAPQPPAMPESAPGPVIGGAESGARTYGRRKTDQPGGPSEDDLRKTLGGLVGQIQDFIDSPLKPSDHHLCFSESQRREILTLLGAVDPESVVNHIRNLVSARVDGGAEPLTLVFSAQQIERTTARCSKGENLRDKLQEFCDYGVNLETGLR